VASRPTILSFNEDATRARLAIVVSRVALRIWITRTEETVLNV